MSSKLGMKLKTKKKLGDSRGNTPNESATSMNENKFQPTIDDLLAGDEIEGLRINEQDLGKVRSRAILVILRCILHYV